MASREFCRHYRAAANFTHCEVGIEMMSVADKTARPLRLPCYAPEVKHLCPQHEHYTEEIRETDAEIVGYIMQLNAFASGTMRSCPECGGAVEAIDLYAKIEPDDYSLYVRPCGHRLGLWSKAPQWAYDAGIVTIIPLDLSRFGSPDDYDTDQA